MLDCCERPWGPPATIWRDSSNSLTLRPRLRHCTAVINAVKPSAVHGDCLLMVNHAGEYFFKSILSQASGATGNGLVKDPVGGRTRLDQLLEFSAVFERFIYSHASFVAFATTQLTATQAIQVQ